MLPDRTWEYPVENATWKEIVAQIRAASEAALRSIARPPADALAVVRLSPATLDGLAAVREHPGMQLRGALWLVEAPMSGRGLIRVHHRAGERTFITARDFGMAGEIYVHTTGRPDLEQALEQALDEVCASIYGKLVRTLCSEHGRDPDLVAAHAALALALDHILPRDANKVTFACFRPAPLDAIQLSKLLRSSDPIRRVTPESPLGGGRFAFIADRSATANVIETLLGTRTRSEVPEARAGVARPVEPAPEPPAHPLQPFVDRLHARIEQLGIRVAAWQIIDDRQEPVARVTVRILELAGDHPHVLAAAAACLANTAWADAAVDALAAHVITVLNHAFSEVTDAAEAHALGKLITS